METTEESRQLIESIQRSYYLHPEDIEAREKDPNGKETKRNEETIKQLEGMLELYPSMTARPHYIESRRNFTRTLHTSF